jgi:hypothetical protein
MVADMWGYGGRNITAAEIGITTLGARRKLVLAISELKTITSSSRNGGGGSGGGANFLSDVFALKDGSRVSPGAASQSRPQTGLMSMSGSLNGSLTGSFDSAGRRWSRQHDNR